jgi:hypothetical protein
VLHRPRPRSSLISNRSPRKTRSERRLRHPGPAILSRRRVFVRRSSSSGSSHVRNCEVSGGGQ